MLAPLVLALTLLCLTPDSSPSQSLSASHAEHLLNRAGFGGTPRQIQALSKAGLASSVESFLTGLPADRPNVTSSPRTFHPFLTEKPNLRTFEGLTEQERRRMIRRFRKEDDVQHSKYRAWWMDEMVRTRHMLREKMALFWHGYFTSSQRDVLNSYHMILQIELFREHGLGNFRALLHRVAKDPAMLSYLDNDQNRRKDPNENFARELMELFTLGPGHYTERDIKEAARAFTGWTVRDNRFVLAKRQHDPGIKEVLGKKGRFGGSDIIDLLLEQPQAPRFLATRLLGYFVGPNVDETMIERTAGLLRKYSWEIAPVLRSLFTDPKFYDAKIIGSRILGPVEFLVALCRRANESPPGAFLATAADRLGQSLLNPPNVKGWEAGDAWITTATFIERGNIAGYLIEGFDRKSMGKASEPATSPRSRRVKWYPTEQIRGHLDKEALGSPESIVEALCDRFLGVPVTAEARESLLLLFEQPKPTRGPGSPTPRFVAPNEAWLKKLVRLILSLPEAQLG